MGCGELTVVLPWACVQDLRLCQDCLLLLCTWEPTSRDQRAAEDPVLLCEILLCFNWLCRTMCCCRRDCLLIGDHILHVRILLWYRTTELASGRSLWPYSAHFLTFEITNNLTREEWSFHQKVWVKWRSVSHGNCICIMLKLTYPPYSLQEFSF